MSRPTPLTLTALLFLLACDLSFPIDPRAKILCDTDADCLSPLVCHPVLRACRQPGLRDDEIPRPSVAFVSPADARESVALDTEVVVAFTRDVTGESLDSRVVLKAGDTVVPLTRVATGNANTWRFALDGTAAVLAPATEYRLTVLPGVEPLDPTAALPSTAPFSSHFLTADVDRPVVAFPAPAAGETDVSVDTTLVLAFSMDVEPASVAAKTHLLRVAPAGEAELAFESSSPGRTFRARVVHPLAPKARYELVVDAGVKPVALGAAPGAKAASITFTTADVARPAVVYADPADGRLDVSLGTRVAVVFNLPVERASVDARVHLRDADTAADVALEPLASDLPTVCAWQPAARLAPSTRWELVVDAGVLPADATTAAPSEKAHRSTFTTAALARPAPAFTSPAEADTGVPVFPAIVLAFTMDVAPASVAARVTLATATGADAPLLQGATGTDVRTFRFEPAARLLPLTGYVLHVAPGIEPAAGLDAGPSLEAFDVPFTTGALPRPRVTYAYPRDGATGVVLRPGLVLAFSQDVAAASVESRVHLVDAAGAPVALERVDTGTASTFELRPAADLAPVTLHKLRVDPGVVPLDTEGSAESLESFEGRFTTGPAPDHTAPATVTDVGVEFLADRRLLTWTPPSDADFAGALVLRRAGAPVTDVPQAGRTYAIGAPLGASEVVGWTELARWIDASPATGNFGYAVFSFDRVNNYSPAATPPFVSHEELGWCTDERGWLTLTSPGAGSQQLYAASAAGRPISEATLLPDPADALGARTVLAAGPGLTLGTVAWLRTVARNAHGRRLGLEQAFPVSPSRLTPLTQPLTIGPGGTAELRVTTYGWTRFEAQVDTDYNPGVESWSATGVTVVGDKVRATIANAGEYRFRVRPVQSGCAAAPWTESERFLVGHVLYVVAGGTGNKTGADPANAMASISDAAWGTGGADIPGYDILVAEGTYTERILLWPGTRYLGGWSTDFLSRDRDAHPTIVTWPDSHSSVLEGTHPRVDTNALVEGFVLRPEASRPVVWLQGSSPTLRNNRMEGSQTGIRLYSDSHPIIEDNVITGSDTFTCDTATAFTLRRNHLSGVVAVAVGLGCGGGLIEGNTIEAVNSGVNYLTALGGTIRGNDIRVSGVGPTGLMISNPGASATPLVIDHNSILVKGSWSETGVRSSGNVVRPVLFTNNVVRTSDAVRSAIGLYLDSPAWVVANNVVSVGLSMESNTIYVGTNQASPTYVNNVFFGAGTAWGVLYEWQAGTPASSFENNAILGTPAFVLGAYGGTKHLTLADARGQLCTWGIASTGNEVLTGALTSHLRSVGGPDGDIDTLADNDWRPVASDAALTAGGKNAGGSTCGAGSGCDVSGTSSCGGVSRDFTNAPRTVPYSIGPWEID